MKSVFRLAVGASSGQVGFSPEEQRLPSFTGERPVVDDAFECEACVPDECNELTVSVRRLRGGLCDNGS